VWRDDIWRRRGEEIVMTGGVCGESEGEEWRESSVDRNRVERVRERVCVCRWNGERGEKGTGVQNVRE